MPPDFLPFQMFCRNFVLVTVTSAFFMVANLYATTPFGLHKTDKPRSISLSQALAMVESHDKNVLLAKEKIAEQKASSWRAWSAYMPKLELAGTATFNFPEAKAQLNSPEQSAQTNQTLADLIDITQGLRTDPADFERAKTQSMLLRQLASSMSRNKSNPIVIQPAQLFDSRLTLTQPILNLEAIASIKKSNIDIKKVEKQYYYALSQAKIDVARSYFFVLQKYNDVQSGRDRLSRARALEKRMKSKYSLGLAKVSDIKRFEAESALAQEVLVQKQSDLSAAKGNLGLQIGELSDFDVTRVGQVKAFSTMHDNRYFIEEALAHRDDLIAQKSALKSAQQSKMGAYYTLAPTISLVAQGAYTTNTEGLTNEPWSAAVLLKANWMLFDGGERYARIREQKSSVFKEKINIADLEKRIEHEVLGILLDIETKTKTLEAVKVTRNAYDVVYKESVQMFDQGLSDVSDIIESNHQLSDSESKYANAQLSLELAQIELANVTGHFSEVINAKT